MKKRLWLWSIIFLFIIQISIAWIDDALCEDPLFADDPYCDDYVPFDCETEYPENGCYENWECGEWSDLCYNGYFARDCTDLNDCGTDCEKPDTAEACTSEVCTDLDGGINEFVLGAVIPPWLGAPGVVYSMDHCNVEGLLHIGNAVIEKYCDENNELQSVEIYCEHGCVDGVCKKPTGNDETTNIVCEDPEDGGIDYYNYGDTVVYYHIPPAFDGARVWMREPCIGDVLYESYCKDGYPARIRYECPNGCEPYITSSGYPLAGAGMCASEEPEEEPEPKWVETDDGIDPYTYGVVYLDDGINYELANADWNYIYDDTCISAHWPSNSMSDSLYEYVINESQQLGVSRIHVECEYGCVHGACRKPAGNDDTTNVYGCEDSDNGKDYETYGYGTFYRKEFVDFDHNAKSVMNDFCANEEILVEIICEDGYMNSAYYECPYKCMGGECVTSDETWCHDTDGGINEFSFGIVHPKYPNKVELTEAFNHDAHDGESQFFDGSNIKIPYDFSWQTNEVLRLADRCIQTGRLERFDWNLKTGDSVRESYCDENGEFQSKIIECEYGCSMGVCRKPTGNDDTTNVICEEIKDGKDPSRTGGVSYTYLPLDIGTYFFRNPNMQFDYCYQPAGTYELDYKDTKVLHELSCEDGYLTETICECDDYCDFDGPLYGACYPDGECKETDESYPDDDEPDEEPDDEPSEVSCKPIAGKIVICHTVPPNEGTIIVSQDALQAHLEHGDYCGACKEEDHYEPGREKYLAQLEEEYEHLKELDEIRAIEVQKKMEEFKKQVELEEQIAQQKREQTKEQTEEKLAYVQGKEIEFEIKETHNEITIGEKTIKTHLGLTFEEKTVYIQTNKGKYKLTITPEQAINKTKKLTDITDIEIDETNGKPIYRVHGKKRIKVFNIFPVTIETSEQVDIETGEILTKHWWDVLVTE